MKIMAKALTLLLALSMLPLSAGCTTGGNSVASSSIASKKPSSSTASTESIATSSEPLIPAVNDYSTRTYNFTEITEYLKINGRYAVTKTDTKTGSKPCISFDHTAQLLAFNADCEGDVVIDMTAASLADEGREEKYFLVVVDGVEERMLVNGMRGTEAKLSLTIAKNLKRGKHTFEVYRQFELTNGICNLVSVTMNGVPTERPKNKDLYIEFFGDSITAGFGNLTTSDDQVNTHYPDKSSGTDTYAFYTAKALNADMSAVARSGLAFSYGITGTPIQTFWRETSYARADLGEYKPERQPDIVVVNLGTNDHYNYEDKGMTREQLYEAAVKFLQMVRKDRPNAKIVWVYGMMGDKIQDEIKQAVEEMGGESKGYYFYAAKRGQNGGSAHPAKADHQVASEGLVEFIKGIM